MNSKCRPGIRISDCNCHFEDFSLALSALRRQSRSFVGYILPIRHGPSQNLPHRDVNSVSGPMFRWSYASVPTWFISPPGDAWQGCHALVRLRTFNIGFTGTTSQANRYGVGQGGNFRAMPADNERNAERWRRLETEARTIASKMTDPEPRRIMFFIAEGYKLLADRAEFRKSHNDQ